MNNDFLSSIDKTWTLFLDRDGVINHEKYKDYVRNWNEFRFYEGVKEALEVFNNIFGTIVMVTNQRGIGKGLMTEEDLKIIHTEMVSEITASSGRIDKIYYCTNVDNDCPDRKPNAGMAHKAKADFKNIDFSKSIIIGNKLSDMQFGRNAGMYTIYLATTNPEVNFPHPLIDQRFDDLQSVAAHLMAIKKS